MLLGYSSIFLVARVCWWRERRQEKDLITCLISRASHSEKATQRFKLITLVPDVCVHTPSFENNQGGTPTVGLREWNYFIVLILACFEISLQRMITFMFLFRKVIHIHEYQK